MHPYIPHLLSDIAEACRIEVPAEQMMLPKNFEEEMEEIENWMGRDEPDHTFGHYCGLDSINFPPPDQLTDNEMLQVKNAFDKMMFTWNLGIDLPEALPLHIAYVMTIDTLNMKTDIVSCGQMSFDFCSGNAPDCIFKQYCPCLKIWTENDYITGDSEGSEKENPF